MTEKRKVYRMRRVTGWIMAQETPMTELA